MSKKKNNNQPAQKSSGGVFEILTLVIALIGGVPGVITAVNFLREKPHLEVFSPVSFVASSYELDSQVLFLSLRVLNTGGGKIFPEKFLCQLRAANGEWVQVDDMLIPQGMHFPENSIAIDETKRRDLQLVQDAISKDSPQRGMLMFRTRKFTREELNKILETPRSVKIICLDAGRNRYEAVLEEGIPSLNENLTFPKEGITTFKKKDNF
jgi:hypothetical protein